MSRVRVAVWVRVCLCVLANLYKHLRQHIYTLRIHTYIGCDCAHLFLGFIVSMNAISAIHGYGMLFKSKCHIEKRQQQKTMLVIAHPETPPIAAPTPSITTPSPPSTTSAITESWFSTLPCHRISTTYTSWSCRVGVRVVIAEMRASTRDQDVFTTFSPQSIRTPV